MTYNIGVGPVTQILEMMQMAVKTQKTAAEQLKDLKSKSKVKTSAPKKNEIRVVDFTGLPSSKVIATLCELAFLANQFLPIIEQTKNAVQDLFFERWTQEMWDNKKVPDNFKSRLKKMDGEKPTTFDDMSCNFIMKFRVDGLTKRLPKSNDLEEDKTVQEVLIDTLMSGVVGLSQDNAHRFAQEEFEVEEATGLPEGGLDKMLSAEEGSDVRIVGQYILSCINCSTKKERDALPILTDAQRQIAVEITQKYVIKNGVEERILGYVETIEQLRNLLNFLSVTKQVSNFEFGISDELDSRNNRLIEIAGRYIKLDK